MPVGLQASPFTFENELRSLQLRSIHRSDPSGTELAYQLSDHELKMVHKLYSFMDGSDEEVVHAVNEQQREAQSGADELQSSGYAAKVWYIFGAPNGASHDYRFPPHHEANGADDANRAETSMFGPFEQEPEAVSVLAAMSMGISYVILGLGCCCCVPITVCWQGKQKQQ